MSCVVDEYLDMVPFRSLYSVFQEAYGFEEAADAYTKYRETGKYPDALERFCKEEIERIIKLRSGRKRLMEAS